MTTLLDLRTRFYNRFDEGQQNYISVDEANSLINEGAAHLHNWIVNSAEFYIWKEYLVTLVAGQMDYDLPADFLKSLKVFSLSASGSPSTYTPMYRIMPEEFRGFQPTAYSDLCGGTYSYMIMGNKLRLIPVPSTPGVGVAMWYAPSFAPMVADTDTTDVSVAPGWDEFVVNQAVIAARIKEESDTSQLERRQAQIVSMIEQSMVNRDMGRHQHVVDVDDGL